MASINNSDDDSINKPKSMMAEKLPKDLTRASVGKTLQQCLEDLKNRKSAEDQHIKSMKYAIDIVHKRFSSLDLNGHPDLVTDYAATNDIQFLLTC